MTSSQVMSKQRDVAPQAKAAMFRSLKRVGVLIALVAVLGAALYAYQALMLSRGLTPEGFKLLTAMPAAQGFEPKSLPTEPVISNRGGSGFAVAFGYKVGKLVYSYTMQLSFPSESDTGKAIVAVRHGANEAKAESEVARRWDGPRKAYAVALEEKFDIEPPVPSLCIKAVIGPKQDAFDLQDASLCVAQRDATGTCRTETLACGLIR